MSTTSTTIADPLGTKLIIDGAATSSAELNVTGAAGTLYQCEIDNTLNTSPVYLKISDSASGATAGTTAPDWQFHVPSGTTITYVMPIGVPFAVGLSFWCVTSPSTLTATDANATTSPASDVVVKILCT